jgi:hypothetical protein
VIRDHHTQPGAVPHTIEWAHILIFCTNNTIFMDNEPSHFYTTHHNFIWAIFLFWQTCNGMIAIFICAIVTFVIIIIIIIAVIIQLELKLIF